MNATVTPHLPQACLSLSFYIYFKLESENLLFNLLNSDTLLNYNNYYILILYLKVERKYKKSDTLKKKTKDVKEGAKLLFKMKRYHCLVSTSNFGNSDSAVVLLRALNLNWTHFVEKILDKKNLEDMDKSNLTTLNNSRLNVELNKKLI
ncbi:hypothetical protein BpHYR1_044346 [Brachionus plicatilis]|uniref:Uncharacterized protein n=1 Tax=Brachionus plicatilis TaxID=10195 RepID=A0A3M7QQ24_BRAPC|nr:hypothetical protein BpHYR1_044346 [Brachionus plicatilis]